MNAGGDAGSAIAQPPWVPNQARLPFRPRQKSSRWNRRGSWQIGQYKPRTSALNQVS
jgi:hypothetical protein